MLNEYALEKLAEAKAKEMEQYFYQSGLCKKTNFRFNLYSLFIKQEKVCCSC